MNNEINKEFEGIYGKYTITINDQLEVKNYRRSLLICGISFTLGIIQWLIFGGEYAWIWILPMVASLGLALKWIHIYIKLLHKTLQFLWFIGSIGIGILIIRGNSQELLANLANKPILILLIGPYFAALTGLGFKEFFCFQRPEAIGLTLLLPISLGGHLFSILNHQIVAIMLLISAMLLLILALRKFGTDASADIGDKSVFEYLKSQT